MTAGWQRPEPAPPGEPVVGTPISPTIPSCSMPGTVGDERERSSNARRTAGWLRIRIRIESATGFFVGMIRADQGLTSRRTESVHKGDWHPVKGALTVNRVVRGSDSR